MKFPILIAIIIWLLLPIAILAQNIDSVSALVLSSQARNIVISGIYGYLTDYTSFNIIDVSNPAEPIILGSYIPRDPGWENYSNLAVAENYALLKRGGVYGAVSVFSINDPNNPTYIRDLEVVNLPRQITDIFSSGNFIYRTDIANWPMELPYNYFFIYNVPDTSEPMLIYPLVEMGFWYEIASVSNGCLYFAAVEWGTGDNLLRIFNLSNPSYPQYINSFAIPLAPHGLAVENNLAFVIDSNLEIIDVSDPSNPALIGTYATLGNPNKVFVVGNYVYLSMSADSLQDSTGIEVVDMSNPQNPSRVGTYLTHSNIADFFVIGDYIFATIDSSLLVLYTTFTGINNNSTAESGFSLDNNYPNPFNASTSISYSLAKAGPVNVGIYNILGENVASLFDGIQPAGKHKITWDADDFPSSVYFARLENGANSQSIKMVLLK